MNDTEIASFRRLCISLAREAGQLALDGRRTEMARGTNNLGTNTKSSATDLVTRYDQASESLIRDRLSQERPDDGVLGEEGTNIASRSGLHWIIDPIDGTTNFVYGYPAWGPSVAVAQGDTVIAGAVHIPMTGETFHAGLGLGAAQDDDPISVNDPQELSSVLIATGFGYDAEHRGVQGRRVASLLPSVRDVRRSGSAAYDLCSVACGRVDAYFEDRLNVWDIAAGLLIALEAGAVANSLDGGPPSAESILVSTPGVHASLLRLLAETNH